MDRNENDVNYIYELRKWIRYFLLKALLKSVFESNMV